MNLGELAKEQPVARLRKVNARAGEEAAVQRSNDGEQYDESHQRSARGSENAFGCGRPHMIAGRDFRNRKYAQVGDISQRIDDDARANSQREREQYVAMRILDFAGYEADLYPP